MPMIPEALFATWACARIGAVHSIVFGGFAAKELSGRILDAKPKLIVAANFGL
jgi:propionyl-CoA synthetase